MLNKKQIAKGHIYSIGGGLLRYDGIRQVVKTDTDMQYIFTVVKPLRSVTREVKPWDKYRIDVWELSRLKNCIVFRNEIFDLLTYEPTLTVLHGKDA